MAITGIDTIEGKQIIAAGAVSAKSAEMAYNDENGNPITGYQIAGDYYSASNPSGFITGVDLTPYQLTADMTAYQPAGDYLTTADSANFYTTANESGFITGVPAGTMNESAFEYDENDKISGYNGSAFAGGSDVPEGVMVESGLEYNAVNEISGYNGSAIAQYGAEKQWLVHDDTLVHAANSAQFALGVNLSAVAQLLGVDETVLWSGNCQANSSVNLTESYKNFEKIKIYGYHERCAAMAKEVQTSDIIATTQKEITLESWVSWGDAAAYKLAISMPCDFTSDTVLATRAGRYVGYWDNAWHAVTGAEQNSATLTKVIGIHRISG